MSDYDVKRITGFANKHLMLAYEVIIYNGDFDKMKKTNSELTWFEEMMLRNEIKWGRTMNRWGDVEK